MTFQMKPLGCDPRYRKIGMTTIAGVSIILFGYLFTLNPARAADSCRECRDFQRACVKAHSQTACKTDYDICIKHCR